MLTEEYVFVFDKDGVITDTETFKLQLLEQILIADFPDYKEKIVSFNRTYRGMFRTDKIKRIYSEVFNLKLTTQILDNYLEKFSQKMSSQLSKIELIPGVLEFIRQNYCTQFISSAAPKEEVLQHLDYFELTPHFQGIYASPKYTNKAKAIEEIKTQYNKKIIFFGDSISDLTYAQQTNINFFGITYCSDAFTESSQIHKLEDFRNAMDTINNYLS